jgi:hypothetical protein
MKKISLVVIAIILMAAAAQAQISTPKLKKFNAGIFMGLGGETGPVLNPLPVLNLSYKGTSLTAGVGLNQGFTVGLVQDLMPLSVAFYNVRWIVSGFYAKGQSDRYFTQKSDYTNYALLTGLRFHFAKHFYSNAQLGMSYSEFKTPAQLDITEWLPFLEFGIGFNLFKSFESKEKPPVTETVD